MIQWRIYKPVSAHFSSLTYLNLKLQLFLIEAENVLCRDRGWPVHNGCTAAASNPEAFRKVKYLNKSFR
jgi:hypothetical protein